MSLDGVILDSLFSTFVEAETLQVILLLHPKRIYSFTDKIKAFGTCVGIM